MKNEKGFSLVELLVVVIIIAIIAAIAIPNLLASRRAANEASAINSLRTIHSAQATYQASVSTNTSYAVNLAGLSGASLIDPALASGTKSGFTVLVTAPAAPNSIYCAHALATTFGSTGSRDFGVDQAGVIYGNATDAQISCAAGVLDLGTGSTAIQ